MMRVTTPVKGFTGTVVNVQFTDGVGETDNPTALAYFARHGYTIGGEEQNTDPAPADTPADAETDADETEEHDKDTPVMRPAGNASKQAWYDYALATGLSEDDLDGLDRNEIRDLVAD